MPSTRRAGPHPAAGPRRRAVRPRRHAAVQGRHRRRRRGRPRPRLLPAGARAGLRGRPRPLRPRRAGRRGDGRPPSCRSAASSAGSAARPTSTPCSQSVPTAANAGYYARIVRETAILRRLIEAGTKIVQLGLRRRRRRRRHRRRRPGRGLQRHRPAHLRGLPPAVGDHGGRARRDRGDRLPRRRDGRGAHRVRRLRRADQRPAPRPDDRARGAAGGRQGAGARHAAGHARRAGRRWARSRSATG